MARTDFDLGQAGKFSSNGHAHAQLQAPSRWLWLAEYRALYEFGFSILAAPLLLAAPRGDRHPVLVLPGFLASDASTEPMRAYLKALGYDAYGWDLGRNTGGVVRMRTKLRRRVDHIYRKTGQTVSIIGWSLGGIYARMLALDLPESVRSVITLGSPFSRDPHASNISSLYETVTGEGRTLEEKMARTIFAHAFDLIAGDLAMPSTSVYSKLDGIVDWRACLIRENARTENIEVVGASHAGLGVHAPVLWAVADRLAQAEGSFTPFRPGGPFVLGYGRGL